MDQSAADHGRSCLAEKSLTTDVAIVGAGPVGLFAVFECGMLKLRCHVIDTLEMIGGQCAALYPEKPIYDIPGYPRIQAQDLVDRLAEQAEPFQPVYHLGQQVTGLARRSDGGWRLTTSKGTVIDATAVVIAAGSGAFGPNRPPLTRSEEHTSELQSLMRISYAVFCLKKKNNHNIQTTS